MGQVNQVCARLLARCPTDTTALLIVSYYSSFLPSMLIAGVSCIIRPSSAVLWLFLASTAIPQGFDKVIRMIRATLLSL